MAESHSRRRPADKRGRFVHGLLHGAVPAREEPDGKASRRLVFTLQCLRLHKVYFEQPAADGFKTAYWKLPSYCCFDVEGYGERELSEQRKCLETMAHLIIRFARNGGFENAPTHILRNIMDAIEARNEAVRMRWLRHFVEIRFYC